MSAGCWRRDSGKGGRRKHSVLYSKGASLILRDGRAPQAFPTAEALNAALHNEVLHSLCVRASKPARIAGRSSEALKRC